MLSALILLASVSMADEKVPVKEGFKTMDMNQYRKMAQPLRQMFTSAIKFPLC